MQDLSIVVASKNARRTIHICLDALVEQSQNEGVEILLIDASVDGSAEIARHYKEIKLVESDPDSLIPELWKIGIELSEGRAVAFTTANFIPAHDWVVGILNQIQSRHAATGGVFEKLVPDQLNQWAIYFLRYASYLPSNSPHTTIQVAADNAVYQRWVFEKYAELLEDGFWEHPINRQLNADGYSLFLTPALKVSMGYFSSSVDFFEQRFLHGRIFGAERAAQVSLFRHGLYVITSPIIPLILLVRVVRNVLKNNSHKIKFFSSLPWILFYLLGWSFGELSGYLFGKPVSRKTPLQDSSLQS